MNENSSKKTIEEIFLALEDEIPNLYPMKIYRVLKRYELERLPEELAEAERKIGKFRKYGIGYLHIDLLYAPKINGQRSYIYTAIDRVAKVAFIMLGKNKRKEAGAEFLRAVLAFYPHTPTRSTTSSLTMGLSLLTKLYPNTSGQRKFILFCVSVAGIR